GHLGELPGMPEQLALGALERFRDLEERGVDLHALEAHQEIALRPPPFLVGLDDEVTGRVAFGQAPVLDRKQFPSRRTTQVSARQAAERRADRGGPSTPLEQ